MKGVSPEIQVFKPPSPEGERGQSRNSSVQTSFARGNFRLRQSGHVPSATDHRLVLGSGLAAFGEELLSHLGIKAVVDDVE